MVNKRGEVTIERGGENNKNEVYEEIRVPERSFL